MKVRIAADGTCDYPRFLSYVRRHHERWTRRVTTRNPRLPCQACGGYGGQRDVMLDDGSGPWEECGWCEGTGYVDGHRRAAWLRYRRALPAPTREG